jgi:type IV secretory pathway VirD2 relaxase
MARSHTKAGSSSQAGNSDGVRDAIAARLRAPRERISADMPKSARGDPGSVRSGLAKRLSTSRLFGTGARGGGEASIGKSGKASFSVPASQRVMVKVFIGRHSGPRGAANPGKALAQHVTYLARDGAGQDGVEASFYSHDGEVDLDTVETGCAGWEQDRHHFRLIISAENADKIVDLDGYVKQVMEKVSVDLKEPNLNWVAINHFDTDQPHTHVLIRGKRANWKDLVIPRAYVSHGIRGRAQEQAQVILGDISRSDAERGLFTRSTANRWTDIDIRLTALARANGGMLVKAELTRHDTVGAFVRARVGHLESLGLATRTKDGVIFAEELKPRLDQLQKAQDVMRTHWAVKRTQGRDTLRQSTRADNDKHMEAKVNAPTSERRDVAVDRLTPVDVELARLGQLRGHSLNATSTFARRDLEARAVHLVKAGYAQRQGHGVGFKPDAWAKLRDADVALALERQLGISGRSLSYGLNEGVVIGNITTSLGKQMVIDRGVGLAIAPVASGQELSIGHVIGTGLER